MTDRFVGVVTGASEALAPYRDRLRLEIDHVSTLMVGPPKVLFPALRDLDVTAAQVSLHVRDSGDDVAQIHGCIDVLKQSGVFDRAKSFCTRFRGDAGLVFAMCLEAFCGVGPPGGHVTIDLTASANSPTLA